MDGKKHEYKDNLSAVIEGDWPGKIAELTDAETRDNLSGLDHLDIKHSNEANTPPNDQIDTMQFILAIAKSKTSEK
ncbi:MAG: hypothetical protein GY804_11045 [Alphaproteobacteria bacterium]|nr:hypothetical protein [Alphaproteobacteria bacterium]